jgi:hypothetical protein
MPSVAIASQSKPKAIKCRRRWQGVFATLLVFIAEGVRSKKCNVLLRKMKQPSASEAKNAGGYEAKKQAYRSNKQNLNKPNQSISRRCGLVLQIPSF